MNVFRRIIDILSPRICEVCGSRLDIDEDCVCKYCLKELPYTNYHLQPYDNYLARLFWKRVQIEKATSLFFYYPHSESARIIYESKYHYRPDINYYFGIYSAQLLSKSHFFDEIDIIVPIPLTADREKERGFNQSQELAKGISAVTGKPIASDIVERTIFNTSQTHLSHQERSENIKNAFRLINTQKARGKHILIVDDIITTGATICECANEIEKAGSVKISVFSLGFSRN